MLLANNLAHLVDIDALDLQILDLTPNNLLRVVDHISIDISISARATNNNYYVLVPNNKDVHFNNLTPTYNDEIAVFLPGDYNE